VIKRLALVCALVVPTFAQSNNAKTAQVTPVAGDSWLSHLHRTFEETSMGKTGRLGPALPDPEDATSDWGELHAPAEHTKQTVTLRGDDLYRLNCRGCHGELGLGAPPEINSVINPTRAMSAQLVLQRMKDRGMDMSRADAAVLANQSKAAMLQRLHNGGTDMPPFPHLSEPEVRAIISYLKQLAEVPGAEKQLASVEESHLRVGEHIVKSTCHICHGATGANPDAEQIFNGAIPPLSTLTMRTSLPEFERKIKRGAPIMMGAPASLFRGRMPVFYYLSEQEVADAYMYLRLYPPVSTTPDPVPPVQEQKRVLVNAALVEAGGDFPTSTPPNKARDPIMIVLPIAAEIFVGLLILGGVWFTVREIRNLRVISATYTAVMVVDPNILQHAPQLTTSHLRRGGHSLTHSEPHVQIDTDVANSNGKGAFDEDEYRTFESSWLDRWFQKEDEAA